MATGYVRELEARYRRVPTTLRHAGRTLSSPDAVAAVAAELIGDVPHERLIVLHLDVRNRLRSFSTVGIGSVAVCPVVAAEVFKCALLANSAAIIVAHNHPSGDAEPSSTDDVLTRRLVEAGKLIDLPVLDHVVIGDEGPERVTLEEQLLAHGLAEAAVTADEAMAIPDLTPPRLIVLNDTLGGSALFGLLRQFQEHRSLVGVPMVVLGREGAAAEFTAAIASGAAAYLTLKGEQLPAVRQTLIESLKQQLTPPGVLVGTRRKRRLVAWSDIHRLKATGRVPKLELIGDAADRDQGEIGRDRLSVRKTHDHPGSVQQVGRDLEEEPARRGPAAAAPGRPVSA